MSSQKLRTTFHSVVALLLLSPLAMGEELIRVTSMQQLLDAFGSQQDQQTSTYVSDEGKLMHDIPGFGEEGMRAQLAVASKAGPAGKFMFDEGTYKANGKSADAFHAVWGPDGATGIRLWLFRADGVAYGGPVFLGHGEVIVKIKSAQKPTSEKHIKQFGKDIVHWEADLVFLKSPDGHPGTQVRNIVVNGKTRLPDEKPQFGRNISDQGSPAVGAGKSEATLQLEKVAYRIGHWQAKTISPVGTEVLVEMQFEWALNESAIVGTYRGHDETYAFEMRFVTMWDAADQKIKSWMFSSNGTLDEMTYVGMVDGEHLWETLQTLGETEELGKKARVTENPAAETITVTGENAEEVVKFTDWKRATNLRFPRTIVPYAPDSKSYYEELKPLHPRTGSYAGNIEFFDPSAPIKKAPLEFTSAWSLNKNFLETHFRSPAGEAFYTIRGWDPVKEVIRVWGFNANGSIGTMEEKIDNNASGTGHGTVVMPDGQRLCIRSEDKTSADGTVTVLGYRDDQKDFQFQFQKRETKTPTSVETEK